MVHHSTQLTTLDNSGARIVECINVLQRHPKNRGITGQHLILTVKKKGITTKIKKGQVMKGIIITTAFNLLRDNGIKLKFNQNNAILLNEQLLPLASRITGPIPRELRLKKFMKLLSMAKRVI